MDRDVGVVVLRLGQLADAVHERERLGEARETELTLERAVDLGPARRWLHGRSMESVSAAAPVGPETERKGAALTRIRLILAAAAAVALRRRRAARRHAAPTKLVATVGPGFTITLTKAGKKVTTLKPGTYSITVNDKSTFHNFHLTGPAA